MQELREHRKGSISLCMIARDEEEFIADALLSVRDLVDEMIVVDTGSRDRTASEARRVGARVFTDAWINDFSAARNAAIDHATKEWILILDADEKIAAADHGRIRDLVAEHPTGAFLFDQRTYSNESTIFGWQAVRPDDEMAEGSLGCFCNQQVRLFRNDPAIRYAGEVHENVEADLAARGVEVFRTGIVVHHYGRIKESTRVHRKSLMYLSLGRKKLEADPRNHRYLYEMATQLLDLGAPGDSIDLARRGLEIEPGSWELWNILGLALLAKGEKREALAAFREAIARETRVADLHNNLGVALVEIGDDAGALAAFEAGLAVAPANANLLRNAASACAALGRHDSALELVARSLAIDPFLPQTHVIHAEILHALGDEEGASSALAKMRFLPETPFKVYLKAIHLALRMKMAGEAERLLTSAMAAHPERDSLIYLAGKIAEMQGDDERAIAQFQKVLALHPSNADIVNSLGCAYERQGRFEEALQSFREAHRLSPHDRQIEVNLGIALDRLGGSDEAERHFLNAVAGGDVPASACNAFGCHLAGAGRYEEAIPWFTKAVEGDAGNAAYYRNLGLACERMNLAGKAAQIYERMVLLDPALAPFARERLLRLRQPVPAGH